MAFEMFERQHHRQGCRTPTMTIYKSGVISLTPSAVLMFYTGPPSEDIKIDLLFDSHDGRVGFRESTGPKSHLLRLKKPRSRYEVNALRFLEHYSIRRVKPLTIPVEQFEAGIAGSYVSGWTHR